MATGETPSRVGSRRNAEDKRDVRQDGAIVARGLKSPPGSESVVRTAQERLLVHYIHIAHRAQSREGGLSGCGLRPSVLFTKGRTRPRPSQPAEGLTADLGTDPRRTAPRGGS